MNWTKFCIIWLFQDLGKGYSCYLCRAIKALCPRIIKSVVLLFSLANFQTDTRRIDSTIPCNPQEVQQKYGCRD